jgi:hypothetical protein
MTAILGMKKHNLSRTPEWYSWFGLKKRCINKNSINYKNYGGRGISVHSDFLGNNGFLNFLNHVGKKPTPNHSIERIKNELGYEPGNIKWATPLEQSLNRRKSSIKSSNFRGVRFIKKWNNWRSTITLNGLKTNLGTFKNEIDAAESFIKSYYNHYKKFPPEYIPVRFKESI